MRRGSWRGESSRACSESSFFSCEFSRFCFSICAFCFRTTFATSSAYDFLSPSIMRYRRCSSSNSASSAGAEVEGPDSLMVERGAGGGGAGSGGAGVRASALKRKCRFHRKPSEKPTQLTAQRSKRKP